LLRNFDASESDINIWVSVISLVAFLSVCVAGVAIAITKGYGTKE